MFNGRLILLLLVHQLFVVFKKKKQVDVVPCIFFCGLLMPLIAPRLCLIRDVLGEQIDSHLDLVYVITDFDLRDALGDLYNAATAAQIHAFICELVAFHVGGGTHFEGPFVTPPEWHLTDPDAGLDITGFLLAHGFDHL